MTHTLNINRRNNPYGPIKYQWTNYFISHGLCSWFCLGCQRLHYTVMVQAHLVLLHFTDVAFSFLNKLKPRYPTSKKIITRSIVILALLLWSGTESVISPRYACTFSMAISQIRWELESFSKYFQSIFLPAPFPIKEKSSI